MGETKKAVGETHHVHSLMCNKPVEVLSQALKNPQKW